MLKVQKSQVVFSFKNRTGCQSSPIKQNKKFSEACQLTRVSHVKNTKLLSDFFPMTVCHTLALLFLCTDFAWQRLAAKESREI